MPPVANHGFRVDPAGLAGGLDVSGQSWTQAGTGHRTIREAPATARRTAHHLGAGTEGQRDGEPLKPQ